MICVLLMHIFRIYQWSTAIIVTYVIASLSCLRISLASIYKMVTYILLLLRRHSSIFSLIFNRSIFSALVYFLVTTRLPIFSVLFWGCLLIF